MSRTRYALVGTGGRAKMYIDAIVRDYADHAMLVGLCDLSQVRMNAYQSLITGSYGLPAVATYLAADFERMIRETQPHVIIVTSMDSTHHLYINKALEMGCDVITEKPMTTHLDKARSILETVERTGKKLTVTFNYRYMPQATRVRDLIMRGVIGTPLKVDFMWTLDVRHGADYFRRWHREKDKSGGLLVHKATHHFDLVNFWIASHPREVFAFGDLSFYGRENATQRGEHYPYERYTGEAAAQDDPFALTLDEDIELKTLYLDAEAETGYLRDRNVFGDNISAEDNMSVLVRYHNGVQLTYSLVAFCPWEGFKLAITGTKGRIELDEIEGGTTFVAGKEESLRLEKINEAFSMTRLRVFPMWDTPYDVPLDLVEGGHGGGDDALLADLFHPTPPPDPYQRKASHLDGIASILVGIAANQSIETGQKVLVDELLRVASHS